MFGAYLRGRGGLFVRGFLCPLSNVVHFDDVDLDNSV